MQGKTRFELYKTFIEFVAHDIQRQRHQVNRKMFSVFFWCFLLPVLISLVVLVLVKLKVFPRNARNHIDWLVLVLPVLYSLYFLGSEVLMQVPAAFKKGGMANTLGQALKEGEWRDQVAEGLSRVLGASVQEWEWIVANFRMDLQAMQYRARYLTALAGAVFFLLMQGIDSIADDDRKTFWMKPTFVGWVDATTADLSQYVGLALFLVLLYLSGSQIYHNLSRYLNCAELVALNQKKQNLK